MTNKYLFSGRSKVLISASINSISNPPSEAFTFACSSIVFKRSTGTFSIVPDAGYCSGIPAPLKMVIEGGGIATQLGRFTVLNLACMGWGGSFMSPVYGFITAACGSEIHTQMGAPYPDLENPPNLFYPYTIIGGSEKYNDASGYFLMYGYTDQETGLWSFTGEGIISY